MGVKERFSLASKSSEEVGKPRTEMWGYSMPMPGVKIYLFLDEVTTNFGTFGNERKGAVLPNGLTVSETLN